MFVYRTLSLVLSDIDTDIFSSFVLLWIKMLTAYLKNERCASKCLYVRSYIHNHSILDALVYKKLSINSVLKHRRNKIDSRVYLYHAQNLKSLK